MYEIRRNFYWTQEFPVSLLDTVYVINCDQIVDHQGPNHIS